MVAIQLPAPRLGGGGLTHNGYRVQPLSVLIKLIAGKLTERMVQAHDVARELHSLGTQ